MVGKKLLLSIAMLGAGIMSVSAQGYYDDDIYYDPAKDTKAKQEKLELAKRKQAAAAARQYYNQNNYDPTLGGHDYAGADTYAVTGTSSRDVDEYNRRGKYAQADTTAGRQAMTDDFAYTRRIEKYHNSDIISDINDPALVEYYYSTQPEVNIIINSSGWYSPWAWNYYDWYWGPSWSWPYYSSWWGPSWSWGWGGPAWGPSWSWGWGPSWSWGWCPGWGWGPSWGWGGPAWRPGWAYNPGSYTPNGRRPVGVRNGYTGVTSNHYRPSYNGGSHRGFATGSTGNFRPGSTSGNRGNYGRPSNNSRPSNNGSYGTTTGNRNSYNRSNNNNYNYNRSNNYNNRSYSTPSYGGGSRGGYSGGGGGGGSHRGGRR